MKTELRPCPWNENDGEHGIECEKFQSVDYDIFHVTCLCGVSGPKRFTEAEAITAWNNRPQTDKAVEMLERMRASAFTVVADFDAVIKELKGE